MHIDNDDKVNVWEAHPPVFPPRPVVASFEGVSTNFVSVVFLISLGSQEVPWKLSGNSPEISWDSLAFHRKCIGNSTFY